MEVRPARGQRPARRLCVTSLRMLRRKAGMAPSGLLGHHVKPACRWYVYIQRVAPALRRNSAIHGRLSSHFSGSQAYKRLGLACAQQVPSHPGELFIGHTADSVCIYRYMSALRHMHDHASSSLVFARFSSCAYISEVSTERYRAGSLMII
jgi:hypothetical protein